MSKITKRNSQFNTETLREKGYTTPESRVDNNKCYECLTSDNGNGYTLCKEVECPKDTEETPSNDQETTSSEPSGTQEQTFDDDKHLSTLDSSTISKIAKVWGVRPDTFYKEIGHVRFYATSKPKV